MSLVLLLFLEGDKVCNWQTYEYEYPGVTCNVGAGGGPSAQAAGTVLYDPQLSYGTGLFPDGRTDGDHINHP